MEYKTCQTHKIRVEWDEECPKCLERIKHIIALHCEGCGCKLDECECEKD